MKKLVTGVPVIFCFLAASVAAEGICATEQCEKAQNIPNLPTDVKSFVDQRGGCDHFRGEPWDGGDDPEVKERREFIFKNINDLCTGTDKRLAELRKKYRYDPMIIELLIGYEDRIEHQ